MKQVSFSHFLRWEGGKAEIVGKGDRFLEEEFPPCQSLAIDFAIRASKRENPEGKISFALLLQWPAASLCSQAKLESERKLLVKNSEGMGILEQL